LSAGKSQARIGNTRSAYVLPHIGGADCIGDNMTKEIKLTQGQVALVDDWRFDELN